MKKRLNKKQIQANKLNHKLYKSLKFIMVVQGYHFGTFKAKQKPHFRLYVSHKPFNFRVNSHTYNINNAKVGHSATVSTKYGKKNLMITKIIHAKGAVAKKMASKLKPVINFRNSGFSNTSTPSSRRWFNRNFSHMLKNNKQANKMRKQ